MPYLCWACRRSLGQELDATAKLGWAKCDRCKKTREQREPAPAPKQQPPTKRDRQRQIKLAGLSDG